MKLHLLLDHDGYLPSLAVLPDGRTQGLKVGRKTEFEPGTVVVVDRG